MATMNNLKFRLSTRINEHQKAFSFINKKQVNTLEEIIKIIIKAIESGHTIYTAGNGGSSCDAQHFAGEFIGKFMFDRKALPAICLCNDIASTYAIGNDYDFSLGLARTLEGIGKKGDVFIAFSTSGNAANIINAAKLAKEKGIKIILILGRDGGKIKKAKLYDLAYIVEGTDSTPRIQEVHGFIMHTICEEVERHFSKQKSKVY